MIPKKTYKDLLKQRKRLILEFRNLDITRLKTVRDIRAVKREMETLDNYLINEIDFEDL